MATVERLLREIRKLPPKQRRRLVAALAGRPVPALVKSEPPLPGEDAVGRKLRKMAAEGRIRLGKPRTGPLPSRTFPGLGGVVAQLLRDRR